MGGGDIDYCISVTHLPIFLLLLLKGDLPLSLEGRGKVLVEYLPLLFFGGSPLTQHGTNFLLLLLPRLGSQPPLLLKLPLNPLSFEVAGINDLLVGEADGFVPAGQLQLLEGLRLLVPLFVTIVDGADHDGGNFLHFLVVVGVRGLFLHEDIGINIFFFLSLEGASLVLLVLLRAPCPLLCLQLQALSLVEVDGRAVSSKAINGSGVVHIQLTSVVCRLIKGLLLKVPPLLIKLLKKLVVPSFLQRVMGLHLLLLLIFVEVAVVHEGGEIIINESLFFVGGDLFVGGGRLVLEVGRIIGRLLLLI